MEISCQIQEIKYYILHKIYTLIRRPLSKRSGQCDVSFSCVIRRHPLQFSLQCSRSTFTHLSQDISRTVDSKNTLFLPTLTTATGGYSSQCLLHVAFENVNSFFSWLELSDEQVAAAYKTFIQDKKDGMIVRVIGGGQWDDVDGSRPISLFIGNTCKKMPVTGVTVRKASV